MGGFKFLKNDVIITIVENRALFVCYRERFSINHTDAVNDVIKSLGLKILYDDIDLSNFERLLSRVLDNCVCDECVDIDDDE